MIRNMFLGLVIAAAATVALPSSASACDCGVPTVGCCAPAPVCCDPAPVCCPPPPVSVKFCAVDPCTGCAYPVSVCLPACCAGQMPCLVKHRDGFFGRRVLTYKFDCGECVEVVVTRRGKVIVR